MDIFSYRFLAILLLAVVVLRILSKRKKRGPSIVQAKQIPIRGQKISSPVTKDSPLACLLDDEKIFGADFKDKDLPELPHSDKCSCQLANVNWRSHEWFNESRAEKKMTGTDLGELNRNEYRYYKYMLIAHHQDSSDQTKEDYQELIENITVADTFKERVTAQLKSSDQSSESSES